MKTYAVRKNEDLWFDAEGFDSFEPVLMSAAKARSLALRLGGVIEEYRAVKIYEYSVPRAPLPEMRLEVV